MKQNIILIKNSIIVHVSGEIFIDYRKGIDNSFNRDSRREYGLTGVARFLLGGGALQLFQSGEGAEYRAVGGEPSGEGIGGGATG
jgi:hypothetical protein